LRLAANFFTKTRRLASRLINDSFANVHPA
jgi:hypothetical protein